MKAGMGDRFLSPLLALFVLWLKLIHWICENSAD
jgi:hypothetical protein